MTETLHVRRRDVRGTRHARRLRSSGQVPAVLYGHGEENISLSIPADELNATVRHGAKLVELGGDLHENAIIRDVQWDAMGSDVLHVDLARVQVGESVETTVSIELRGESPGSRQGGIVEHLVHDVLIECPVTSIPESLTLNINDLQLGDSMSAADLTLPDGAKLLVDENTVVVHCTAPVVAPEEEEAPAVGGAEPEVIGRKAAEDEETD